MTRYGKIARLPTDIRTELNQRILDGQQGQPLEEKRAPNDAQAEKAKDQADSGSWPTLRWLEKPRINPSASFEKADQSGVARSHPEL